jgi:hypothetical protein
LEYASGEPVMFPKGGLPIRIRDNVFAQTVAIRRLYTSF